jgi:hypothetical protein
MAAAWPLIRDRVLSAVPPLLTGVTVWDGRVVTQAKPASWLTVGYQPSTVEDSAGSYEQSPSQVGGYAAEENGTLLMEAGARTGSTETPDAFGIADVVHGWVDGDMTLGGLLPQGSTASVAVQVVEAQQKAGAVQRLLITLTYFTRV